MFGNTDEQRNVQNVLMQYLRAEGIKEGSLYDKTQDFMHKIIVLVYCERELHLLGKYEEVLQNLKIAKDKITSVYFSVNNKDFFKLLKNIAITINKITIPLQRFFKSISYAKELPKEKVLGDSDIFPLIKEDCSFIKEEPSREDKDDITYFLEMCKNIYSVRTLILTVFDRFPKYFRLLKGTAKKDSNSTSNSLENFKQSYLMIYYFIIGLGELVKMINKHGDQSKLDTRFWSSMHNAFYVRPTDLVFKEEVAKKDSLPIAILLKKDFEKNINDKKFVNNKKAANELIQALKKQSEDGKTTDFNITVEVMKILDKLITNQKIDFLLFQMLATVDLDTFEKVVDALMGFVGGKWEEQFKINQQKKDTAKPISQNLKFLVERGIIIKRIPSDLKNFFRNLKENEEEHTKLSSPAVSLNEKIICLDKAINKIDSLSFEW